MIKKWLQEQKAKAILLQVFKSGELGIEYAYGKNKGMIYPKIRKVKFDQDKKTVNYYFSIPQGMDPKDIKKKEYCFKQTFGESIEIKGDIKEFKLTVFAAPLPSKLTYDFEQYAPSFEKMELPVVAGLDLNGNLIVFDLVKNPHLLIAGETGSGKSTQLRSVLSTFIQALPPKRLELYLCDLKRSEFHIFRNVKHVKGVYITPAEIKPVLTYLQGEMKRRGDLLDRYELSHVHDLQNPPKNIILCIDEVALLQDEKDIMKLVEEISAIGRALGVFLILSMQRPDRQVLDGKLKNNLTVRMGFKCADLTNSRIIGTPGSEKLKQEGRMLLKLPAYSDLIETQAPFLQLANAKKILEGYRCPKEKDTNLTPSSAYQNVQETKNTIFGVLNK